MRKILVMSDTHSHLTNMKKALKKFADVDCIIHLGDYAKDTHYLRSLTEKKVYSVKGNCDIYCTARQEMLIRTSGVKILALHGHKQGVKQGLLGLGLYARSKGADIVLFGHTHMPAEEPFGDMILYNPGSLGEPRERAPTVGVMTVDKGKIKISTCKV